MGSLWQLPLQRVLAAPRAAHTLHPHVEVPVLSDVWQQSRGRVHHNNHLGLA
jgi:hypothetical protein